MTKPDKHEPNEAQWVSRIVRMVVLSGKNANIQIEHE